MRITAWILSTAVVSAMVAFGPSDPARAASANDAHHMLSETMSRLQVLTPIRYRNLTIFPIRDRDVPAGRTPYLTLDEALRGDDLSVTELGDGNVNEVIVANRSDRAIFLMAGEVIVGAKQDRMIADDTLVPPDGKKRVVRVYCTEHGRWSGDSMAFGSSGLNGYVELRSRARQSANQSDVWAEIDRKRVATKASAPTSALRSVQNDAKVKERIDTYRQSPVGKRPPAVSDDTVGVVVAVSGRIKAIDIFGSHDLLTRLWSKLLDSYVMDAVGGDDPSSRGETNIPDIGDARRFLRLVSTARATPMETPGAGDLLSLRSGAVAGQALLHRDRLVHLEAFPARDMESDNTGGRLTSPYRRIPANRQVR